MDFTVDFLYIRPSCLSVCPQTQFISSVTKLNVLVFFFLVSGGEEGESKLIFLFFSCICVERYSVTEMRRRTVTNGQNILKTP